MLQVLVSVRSAWASRGNPNMNSLCIYNTWPLLSVDKTLKFVYIYSLSSPSLSPSSRSRKMTIQTHTNQHNVICFVFRQSKPLIPLQKDEDPDTHKTVLTNYMFPQQTRTEECEYYPLEKRKKRNWQSICPTLQSQMYLKCMDIWLQSYSLKVSNLWFSLLFK